MNLYVDDSTVLYDKLVHLDLLLNVHHFFLLDLSLVLILIDYLKTSLLYNGEYEEHVVCNKKIETIQHKCMKSHTKYAHH